MAGMESPDSGLLGLAPFSVGHILVPRNLWLEENQLRYDRMPDKQRDNPDGMLDAFVRIETAEDVLRFATRWGPLDICAHGLPSSHRTFQHSALEFGEPEPTLGECWTDGLWQSNKEDLEFYLLYSRAARAILNLAAAAHQGALGEHEDWIASGLPFYTREWMAEQVKVPGHLGHGRFLISTLVSEWMRIGGIQPVLFWYSGEPEFQMSAETFGILGLQLMNAVTRAHGFAICSGCGRPYIRTGRRPQAGRRNYCPTCGSSAWLRDAQRDYRKRRKSGEEG